MEAKQVIVIRRDLKMRRGKEIAQGAHASMAWLTARLSYHAPPNIYVAAFTTAERAWIDGLFTKVTVQVDSEDELHQVLARAAQAEVQAYEIVDAGKTEFNGVPTLTAVAVGPDWGPRVDEVTGTLKLY
jgi:peptidyl-tRNA hydrolase, PTH2 family